MDIKPLIGLAGALLGTTAGDLNDYLGSTALVDLQGSLGIGHDAGTWVDSLYLSAQPVGMAVSAWMMITLSLRRWVTVVIALVALSSLGLPLSPNVEVFYALRLLQGFAGGLMTPLLMDTALFVLPPPIRLYGLAVYALTATVVPSLASSLAAVWLDVLHWPFVFYQALPLCALGAALTWYGLPQDPPQYERFRVFDWRAMVLVIVGIGSFTTMLFHGDRLDWFNSKTICVLALVSAVAIPLLVVNEWVHPLPLLKLQMLQRRNFAYGVLGLFIFIIVSQASAALPVQFLTEVQGQRPVQANWVTLEIAATQMLLLPCVAVLLNVRWVDARLVSLVGLALMMAAAIGSSFVTIYWLQAQFYLWQAVASVGQALVVIPLLMLSTNMVFAKIEAPWASALVNFPRSIAEVVAVWLIDLVQRWRGHLHSERIVDQVGADRWRVIEGRGVLPHRPPPLTATGHPGPGGGLESFSRAVETQVQILTYSDLFLVLAALMLVLAIILLVLPVRGLPPRLDAVEVE